ncbi:hypothetical protein KDL01_04400 [Actinospica durhamensis]|uniref:Uncharacterized protein n=1 Tax=Actinospica durhamensis TaxID=1508375 RepID=A0A941IM56_9ACTN|nr:hypothetical protein [Actinospica durhamensis]MBR7832484.1 hypothetical protein [Actinospica durhamensis]
MLASAIAEPAVAQAATALDLTYGERDAQPCATCGGMLPAATRPLFELETPDGEPLCRPCASRTHAPLAAAVAFLTAVTKAYGSGDTQRVGEAIQAVLSGMDLWHEVSGVPVPVLAPPAARKPRYAPKRRRR